MPPFFQGGKEGRELVLDAPFLINVSQGPPPLAKTIRSQCFKCVFIRGQLLQGAGTNYFHFGG